ncbi:MAG: reprolysin-like metallopeptidase, partial [Phycisphaerales bacterium]
MKALSFAAVLLACSAMGQVGVAHHDPDLVGEPGPRPTKGVLLEIDIRGLNAALASAPLERLDAEFENYGTPLTLIGPDGQGIEFFAVESPVMEPGLGAKFPEFKTYVLRSLDGGHAGRLEITPRGVTAMIRAVTGGDAEGRGGTWMIDPWQSRDPAHAIVYWMRDLPGSTDWECETIGDAEPLPTESGGYADRFVQNRLTYRIAVACTGEYGAHHSALQGNPPNIADPLAAIVTVVARTNVVYEADLGVHFNLVANNDLLMFTDGTTDPYTSTCGGSGGTDCSGSILGENPGVINGAIGSANYDIGHCVTRIFGGVANLRCVCTNNKARGVSGIPRGGDVDPLSALVVIHEIGHQFGANHTFNGTRGRCAGNVNLPTGWEAGSGSTPMAYAGGCPVGDAPPSDNIVQFAEPYFHHGSYLEMNRFITGNGGSCAVSTPTANDT